MRFTTEEWTGSFEAFGGSSSSGYGGAGSIYTDSGTKTKLIIANKEAFPIDVRLYKIRESVIVICRESVIVVCFNLTIMYTPIMLK